jgi:hypothetical protein
LNIAAVLGSHEPETVKIMSRCGHNTTAALFFAPRFQLKRGSPMTDGCKSCEELKNVNQILVDRNEHLLRRLYHHDCKVIVDDGRELIITHAKIEKLDEVLGLGEGDWLESKATNIIHITGTLVENENQCVQGFNPKFRDKK